MKNIKLIIVFSFSQIFFFAPAQTAEYATMDKGIVKGRLVWGGDKVPQLRIENTQNTNDPECKSKTVVNKELIVDPSTKGISYGIAYLVNPTGDFSLEEKNLLENKPEIVIGQTNCEICPFITIAHKDQKIKINMSEFKGHSLSVATSQEVGRMIRTDLESESAFLARQIKKEVKRPVKIQCDVHPWMKSYVLNIDHPFAVITKVDGSFEITGIPSGNQHLIIWHPAKGYLTVGGNKGMNILIKAGETLDIGNIKLSIENMK